MKVKEVLNLENIFGDLTHRIIWSTNPFLKKFDKVRITNTNCELTYDSIEQRFDEDAHFAYIVELDLLEVDLSEYEPAKSNNGGCYAFADCTVIDIIEEGY